MTLRSLSPLFLGLVLAMGSASAQTLGARSGAEPGGSGIRFGIGVGPSVYNGPNVLYPLNDVEQENVTEVRPAVTAFVAFPLGSDRLYGRAMAGVLNIGADGEPSISGRGGNPFLTNENLLLEGDLMLNLVSPQQSRTVPYLFSGIGALIADPFGDDEVARDLDRKRAAYFLPLGAGVDVSLTRNLGLFAEASYRFPLSSPGRFGTSPRASASRKGPTETLDPCEIDPTSVECKKACENDPSGAICVLLDEDKTFDTSFGAGLLTGGLRFGFGGPPARASVPAPVREVIVERETVRVQPPPPERPVVCDLVELNQVYFDHGSTTLSLRAQRLLDENVALLLDNPACCVFIDGYTDSSEGERFGAALAARRAQAVYDYYLANGVSASRLQIRNRGAAMPACDKEDPGLGCSRNRRVESVPMDCDRFERILSTPSPNRY